MSVKYWTMAYILWFSYRFAKVLMMNGKYIVRDVLLIMSKIKMYKIWKSELMSEIPKKVKDLVNYLKIDLGMLYKEA